RQGFEPILFYKALLTSAGLGGRGGGTTAVLGGVFVGAAALVLVYIGINRFGLKVPLKPFFAITSAMLYYMAFVFAGKGIADLQEAGLVKTTVVEWAPRIPVLGIYPTLQSLSLQLLLLVLLLVAIVWLQRQRLTEGGERRRRAREQDVQVWVHRTIGAQGDRDSGGEERAQGLRRARAARAVAPPDQLGDGEVSGVLHHHDSEPAGRREQVGCEEVTVLDPRPQRVPGRVRRRARQEAQQHGDRAVSHGVHQQLLTRGEGLAHDRGQRLGREVELAVPLGPVGVRVAHRGTTLHGCAVEDVLDARDAEFPAGARAGGARVGDVPAPGPGEWETDDAPPDRHVCGAQ